MALHAMLVRISICIVAIAATLLSAQAPAARDLDDLKTQDKVSQAPPLPLSVAEALPQATGGLLIGANHVGFATGRGVIKIGKQIGKFARIRLQVRDSDIYIDGVQVIYADGTTVSHAVDLHIPEGRTSEWMEIDGSRFIDHLEIHYRAKPESDGLARIEVIAEHAADWLSETGEGHTFNNGWILLGSQSAGFVGFDTDIIPIGDHISGFKTIQVVVRERAITLNQVRVIYENGDEDIIPVRARVGAGDTFGPIELRHAPRRIREIQARYRSRFIDDAARAKDMAIVEIWGRR